MERRQADDPWIYARINAEHIGSILRKVREDQDLKQPALVRALFYLICFYSLIFYGESDGKAFIYFQF